MIPLMQDIDVIIGIAGGVGGAIALVTSLINKKYRLSTIVLVTTLIFACLSIIAYLNSWIILGIISLVVLGFFFACCGSLLILGLIREKEVRITDLSQLIGYMRAAMHSPLRNPDKFKKATMLLARLLPEKKHEDNLMPLLEILNDIHDTKEEPNLVQSLKILKNVCQQNNINFKRLLNILQDINPRANEDRDITHLLEKLNNADKVVKQLIAYIACRTTDNLTSSNGEVIRQESYLRLLEISLKSPRVKDITLISLVSPSTWYENDDADIEAYFVDQKEQVGNGVKIRRFQVGKPDVYGSDPKRVKYENQHKKAGVDLFFLDETEFTNHKNMDMGMFFATGANSGWMIQSDLNGGVVGKSKLTVVTVWLKHDYETGHDLLRKLLRHYRNDYNTKVYRYCDMGKVENSIPCKITQMRNQPDDNLLTEIGLTAEAQ